MDDAKNTEGEAHDLDIDDDVEVDDAIRISMRSYFSSYLRWTAQHMSALVGQVEDRHSGGPSFDIEHRSYVLSSILASALFIEANVNELYQDAHDAHNPPGGYLAPLGDETVSAMAGVWRASGEGAKLQPLAKWQLLLTLAGHGELDPAAQPYQDAQLVIQLRNAFATTGQRPSRLTSYATWTNGSKGSFPITAA